MVRNCKTLGVVLIIAFAFGATVIQSASAQGRFTSTGPVALTGTETGVFANRITAFGTFIECPGSTYVGYRNLGTPHLLIPSGATTTTVVPQYKEKTGTGSPNCSGSFGTGSTIDMNGCDYRIQMGFTTGGVSGTYGASLDINCPVGKEITITVWLSESAHTTEPSSPKCILHIPAQIGLAGLHATDTGNGTFDLTGSAGAGVVKQTRNSILCPAGTQGFLDLHFDVSFTGKNESGQATSVSLSD
jgi:hypothetical protein